MKGRQDGGGFEELWATGFEALVPTQKQTGKRTLAGRKLGSEKGISLDADFAYNILVASLLLVLRPGAPSSVLAPSSDDPSSFLLLV